MQACVSVYVYKCMRVLHVERACICEGSGHVQGGGTAPFAKLTALDRGPGILYVFLDPRPAILRWIFATETIVVPHPRFFFHRIFLHLPRVISPIGDVRRADLRRYYIRRIPCFCALTIYSKIIAVAIECDISLRNLTGLIRRTNRE